jgi:catechol 2,3-dioxygenase-like lactoylglutathione lyase family enzyme
MTANPKLDLIVLDCPDAHALATFYGAVLGWSLEEGAGRDWAGLAPPGGGITPDNPDGRPSLAFQRIDDFVTPTWPGGAHPQQLHLDLCTPDLAATEDLVLTAGARKHEHQPNHDRFRVFVDPAGHPFCLIPG